MLHLTVPFFFFIVTVIVALSVFPKCRDENNYAVKS